MNFSYLNPKTFRYERKFLISQLDRHQVESIIKRHPAMFSEIYHERCVNNIYFDSLNMDNYLDNESGTSQRVKTRLRWYGDLFGMIQEPALQLKIKDGIVGSKISFPLNPFTLDSNFSSRLLKTLLKASKIPALIKEELLLMQPALLNHYSRKYFQSADKKYRLTLDWDMEFYTIEPSHNTFIKRVKDLFYIVLELKYSDKDDDIADTITNYFPFRLSKSSKYVRGIDYLA